MDATCNRLKNTDNCEMQDGIMDACVWMLHESAACSLVISPTLSQGCGRTPTIPSYSRREQLILPALTATTACPSCQYTLTCVDGRIRTRRLVIGPNCSFDGVAKQRLSSLPLCSVFLYQSQSTCLSDGTNHVL